MIELSCRFGTKRVFANRVYQEYIQDKSHLHMNSTRWVTLSGFVQYLGKAGIARVDETEKGWFIAWIDNSPKTLAKQAAAASKERSTMSDEQRERLLIAEQIDRAKDEAGGSGNGSGSGDDDDEGRGPRVEEGLKRDAVEGGKVVLSFSRAKTSSSPATVSREGSAENNSSGSSVSDTPAPATPPSDSTPPPAPIPSSTPAPSIKVGFNAFKSKSNALKPTGINPGTKNVLKMGTFSVPKSDTPSPAIGEKRKQPLSAAQQLILEDQERKKRRMEKGAVRV